MSITSAGGTRWADEANDKLAELLADVPEEIRPSMCRREASARTV